MNDPINLNRVRKAKHKATASATAAENRVKFGRSNDAKAIDAAARAKVKTRLDQAKREP
ncbi:MAG: DUF4169 family protein [Pseudomonadota bacterium]|nr:DUF4169 family protein [Pseudomonadota bacterium]